jgi:hypothetical protein
MKSLYSLLFDWQWRTLVTFVVVILLLNLIWCSSDSVKGEKVMGNVVLNDFVNLSICKFFEEAKDLHEIRIY